MTFTLAGARILEAYRQAAEANAVIAEQHAAQIDQLRRGYNALAEAGGEQHRLAELREQIIVEERRRHAWEKIGYWVGMAVLGVAAIQ